MRLKQLALMRQEKLFGAHEIQRFNRDADETVAWISEKDVVLSSDDYGRDLASVQTLQVEICVICIPVSFKNFCI
jgi:spectrin alpha